MWEDLYAELLNKIRWAIASSVSHQSNMSYGEQRECAKPLASLILEGLKIQNEKPDFVISRYIDQQLADKQLDKIIA